MRLADLAARFVQDAPLATGIFTGLYYLCPNDPSRKRGHVVAFEPIINPYRGQFDEAPLLQGLPPSWTVRRWTRIGESIDTLTLSPSIARPCCHISIVNGGVTP